MTDTMAETYKKSITGALQNLGLHERVKVWTESHNEGTNHILFIEYGNKKLVVPTSDEAQGINAALRMVKEMLYEINV